MFCPQCRNEFVPGITMCSDCGVALVEALPEPEPYKFIEILRTFNLSEIAFIKSILDDSDIEYFFLGENFNRIEQLVQPARLAVREDQVEEAKEILKDLELRYFPIDSRDKGDDEQ